MTISHRGTMSRAVHKSAWIIGIGIVQRQGERTQRGIRNHDRITVHVVLSAGSRILQIVLPVVLGHPRTLDIGSDS